MTASVLIPLRRRPSSVSQGVGDFDRLFNNLFGNALGHIAQPAGNFGDLGIPMDVSETEHSYHLSADLPGVEDADIELTVSDGVLTLKGEKHGAKEEDGKIFHRSERRYGSFRRVLQLPADADENKVTAKMHGGVLDITVEKRKETAKSVNRIDITRA